MSESMESEAGSGASEGGFESAGAALGVDLSSGEAVASPPAEVAPEVPETPQEDAGWLEPFGVDDRAYIANKGWQSHEAILKSYRAAETRIGGPPADSVQVPDWENPEQVSKFRSQIGVPEQMSDYPELAVETTRGALEMSTMAEISHELRGKAECRVQRGDGRVRQDAQRVRRNGAAWRDRFGNLARRGSRHDAGARPQEDGEPHQQNGVCNNREAQRVRGQLDRIAWEDLSGRGAGAKEAAHAR